jgi:hypothetical protein
VIHLLHFALSASKEASDASGRFAATVLAPAAPPTFAQQKDDLDALNASQTALSVGKAPYRPISRKGCQLALSKKADSVCRGDRMLRPAR